MNQNRSFLVTLLLAVGAGVAIGLFAFGLSGKDTRPASPPAPAVANAAAPAPLPAASPVSSQPSPQAEPMPPVQYDSPDAANGSTAPGDLETIAPPGQPAIR